MCTITRREKATQSSLTATSCNQQQHSPCNRLYSAYNAAVEGARESGKEGSLCFPDDASLAAFALDQSVRHAPAFARLLVLHKGHRVCACVPGTLSVLLSNVNFIPPLKIGLFIPCPAAT